MPALRRACKRGHTIDNAVRELEKIQMNLIRLHAQLAQQPMSLSERHQVDRYFDAFASDLVGLEEFLRGMRPADNR